MATTTRILDANVSGTVYTINANDALAALDTCHSGATAPTDEVANGKFWLDTSTTPSVLKVYDNAGWNIVYSGRGDLTVAGTVNATALAGDGTGITGVATAAQGALADTAVQPADNISTLTNDAGYLTVAPSPFEPTTVTGTTPSLDLGSFNFFDNGTLSGDTTVSFASVPTQARWSYSFGVDYLSTWDILNLSYDSVSKLVSAEETTPTGLFFKPDGTKMYVIGFSGDDVNEYDLSTPWDVSTASFLQLFSVSAKETTPIAVFFKPDGTSFFIIGYDSDAIHEYSLSTAWNVSTAIFVRSFSVAAKETVPETVFFKPDGTKMYTTGQISGGVHEYSLSTAWNISTASFVRTYNYTAQTSLAKGLFFKPDGTTMFLTVNDVYEYSLSTAWDISTASFVQLVDVRGQDTSVQEAFFRDDGVKLYLCGRTNASIYQYTISTLPVLTLPVAISNPPTLVTADGDTVTYEFTTLDGGTTVRLINEEVL